MQDIAEKRSESYELGMEWFAGQRQIEEKQTMLRAIDQMTVQEVDNLCRAIA